MYFKIFAGIRRNPKNSGARDRIMGGRSNCATKAAAKRAVRSDPFRRELQLSVPACEIMKRKNKQSTLIISFFFVIYNKTLRE